MQASPASQRRQASPIRALAVTMSSTKTRRTKQQQAWVANSGSASSRPYVAPLDYAASHRSGPLTSKIKVLRSKLRLKTRETEYLMQQMVVHEARSAEREAEHQETRAKMKAIEDLFIDNLQNFKKLELERKALSLGLSKGDSLKYADANAPSAVESDLDVLCTMGSVEDILGKAGEVSERNVSVIRRQLSKRENECLALQVTQEDLEGRLQTMERLLRATQAHARESEVSQVNQRQVAEEETRRREEAEAAIDALQRDRALLQRENDAYRGCMAQFSRSVESFVREIKEETTRRQGYLAPRVAKILDRGPILPPMQPFACFPWSPP